MARRLCAIASSVVCGLRARSYFFFFSSRRRHTRFDCDWSSDVCSSDLELRQAREHLHQALRASEELRLSAESANHAKDDFISTVSHELRTPLNTIRDRKSVV